MKNVILYQWIESDIHLDIHWMEKDIFSFFCKNQSLFSEKKVSNERGLESPWKSVINKVYLEMLAFVEENLDRQTKDG